MKIMGVLCHSKTHSVKLFWNDRAEMPRVMILAGSGLITKLLLIAVN